MSIPLDKVAQLLHIVEKAAGHSGKLSSLSNAAMKELLEINEKARQEGMEEEKKLAAKRAEEDAKIRTKLEADERVANAPPKSVLRPGEVPDENPNIRPSVYPGDSDTATIADRRL